MVRAEGKRQLPFGSTFCYQNFMSDASSDNRSPKRPGQSGTMIGVRLQPDDLAELDAWITAQPEPLSRPAAIRRLMSAALQA